MNVHSKTESKTRRQSSVTCYIKYRSYTSFASIPSNSPRNGDTRKTVSVQVPRPWRHKASCVWQDSMMAAIYGSNHRGRWLHWFCFRASNLEHGTTSHTTPDDVNLILYTISIVWKAYLCFDLHKLPQTSNRSNEISPLIDRKCQFQIISHWNAVLHFTTYVLVLSTFSWPCI